MSTWLWQARAGRYPDVIDLTGWTTLDAVYDAAEAVTDSHVSIMLKTDEQHPGGLADSRDHEGEWVCGRERWRANEAAATFVPKRMPPEIRSEISGRLLGYVPQLRPMLALDEVTLPGAQLEEFLQSAWLIGYGEALGDVAKPEKSPLLSTLAQRYIGG